LSHTDTEADFMNVNFVEFLGIILRVLWFEVSIYNVYITNQCHLQTTFAGGGVRNPLVQVTFVPIMSKNLDLGLEVKYEYVKKIPASSVMHAVNMYAEIHHIHFTHRQTVLQDTKK
jgi:hypothetical protein